MVRYSYMSLSTRLTALIFILILSGSFALLQYIALSEFLYWKLWYFDNIMHLIGGFILGAIAVTLSLYSGDSVMSRYPFLTLLSILVVAGLGWEAIKFFSGAYVLPGYTLDTLTDLAMNTLGALIVYLTIFIWNKN